MIIKVLISWIALCALLPSAGCNEASHDTDEPTDDAAVGMDASPDRPGDFRPVVPIEISPSIYGFGTVGVGFQSLPCVLRITNNREVPTGALNTIVAAVVPDGPSPFLITNDNCKGEVLASGRSCAVTIVMRPTAVGTVSAMIRVGDGQNLVEAEISGTGTTDVGIILAEPSKHDFGGVKVGGVSSVKTFRIIRNTFEFEQRIDVSLGGENPSHFKVAQNRCGIGVVKERSCEVDIVFEPKTSGRMLAELVLSAMPGGRVSIGIIGMGIEDIDAAVDTGP